MLVIIIGMRTQNVGVYDNAVVHIRGGNVLKIKREKGKTRHGPADYRLFARPGT